jgi:hypothetical protein
VKEKGNIRDYANVSQLVCLSNLENLNAVFINDKLPQAERLTKLNQIAIQQMKILVQDTAPKLDALSHPFGILWASPFGIFRLCSIVLLFSILIKHPI